MGFSLVDYHGLFSFSCATYSLKSTTGLCEDREYEFRSIHFNYVAVTLHKKSRARKIRDSNCTDQICLGILIKLVFWNRLSRYAHNTSGRAHMILPYTILDAINSFLWVVVVVEILSDV